MYKDDGSFTKPYLRQIGTRMAQNIHLAKKSKAQVAAEMGISRAAMTQYCNGDSTPTLSSMARFCQIVNVPMDFIVYGADPNLMRTIIPAMEGAIAQLEDKRRK